MIMPVHIEDDLITIRDFMRWGVSRLTQEQAFCGHGTDSLWDEVVHLVFSSLHLPWNTDQRVLDARLTREERKRLVEQIEKRSRDKIPNAYLLNEAWFCDLPFYVDQRVLIPRSPIAELIQHEFEPWLAGRNVTHILDLCAGSGCIGIACALTFPEANVDLVDISSDAIAVAQINIEKHAVQAQVKVIESNLFGGLTQRYDIIVSNPPYVDAVEMAALPAEYRHEPVLGLAAGEDGLDIAHRILREAKNYLTDNGLLIVEVGASEEALINAYPEVPFTWLEFANGGSGVFLLTAQQVKEYF
jgi:ribosomal protein L3 glutamine methyltransferase